MARKWREITLSRTYMRFMLPYLAILIVAIASLGSYMFGYLADTIEKSFYETEATLLGRLRYSHETGINSIIGLADQITVWPGMSPFRLSPDPDPIQADPLKARDLINHLSALKLANGFVSDICLLFDIDEYVLSSTTSIHIDMFVNKGLIYENLAPEELISMLRKPGRLSVIPMQNVSGILLGNKNIVTFILPIGVKKNGAMLFIIDTSQYAGMFAQDGEVTRGSYILYDGKIITGKMAFGLPDTIVEEFLAGTSNAVTDSLFYEGEEYLITTILGDGGFLYCAVQRKSVLMESLSARRLRFWVLLVMAGLIILLLIIYSSVYNYKPVRALRNLTGDTQTRDDFEAIETSIRDIRTQNQVLTDKSLSLEKYEFIRSFANGSYKSREELLHKAETLGLRCDRHWYAIALLGARMDIPSLLNELCARELHDEAVDGYYVELATQDRVLFTLFSDERDALYEYVQKIHHIVRSQQGIITLAVSGRHENVAHAATAYLEASTAFDNRFVLGNSSVLYFDDVNTAGNTASYPIKLINSLKNVLRSGDLDSVDNMINELFRYTQTMKLSLFAFRAFYNDIISVIMNECVASDNVDGAELYNVFSLSRCLSIEELNEMLRNVCHRLLLGAPQTDSGLSVIQAAAIYMQENYSSPELSMSFLAEQLSLSARAFSEKFKEQTGINPSDYLVQIRLDKAKKLLTSTELSIKDISLQVGYYDVSGFIRRFKKYTGITPVMYRQMIDGKQDALNE